MGILKYPFYLFMAVILTGCYETFSPDIEDKPVLCINSLIKAGEPIDIKISHTWVYSDLEAMKNHDVDAEVAIFANDMMEEDNYIPKEGDHIKIIAKNNIYGTAEAETTVPYVSKIKPVACDLDILDQTITSDEQYPINIFLYFNLLVKIEITDISDFEDFYHLSFKDFYLADPLTDENIKDPDYFTDIFLFYTPGYLDYDAEPIFFENVEEFESVYGEPQGFNFFTDKRFSDNSYTLTLLFRGCRYQLKAKNFDPEFLDCGMKITLHSVSKSYYDWEFYSQQIDSGILNDITEWGFSDPIWGYSNVSTGAGVVAAESSTHIILNLKDYLEKILNR